MEQKQADPNYRWKVLSVVMIGTLMSALDSSIVNVSIPAIMADFGASLDDIEWVITAYMLAFATLMPLTVWLRDRVGHKFLYFLSLLVFTGGSVLCGMAWSLPVLIFARVIQAVGGGALTPTGMAMISENFEPHERGRAMGFWAMGAVMGPAFGPTVGGYLTKHFGWPSIFLVNLPVGLIGLWATQRILKEDRPAHHNGKGFDFVGFVFLSIFLVAFLLGMSKGESKGWESQYVVTCGILSIVGLVGFLLSQKLVENHIMDLKLLEKPVFLSCFILTAARSVALYGGTFLLPLYLQNFKGMDEVDSGLVLLPGSLLMGVLMPIAGRIADKVSPRMMAFWGFCFLSMFFWEYRTLDLNTSTWMVIVPTLVRGLGISLLIAPLTATALNAVSNKDAGMASSMLNIIQQVGGSIGIALLGLVLHRRTTFHLNDVGTVMSSQSDSYREYFARNFWHMRDVGLSIADALHAAGAVIQQYAVKYASVLAFEDAFIVGALISILSLIAVFFLPSEPIGKVDSEHMAME